MDQSRHPGLRNNTGASVQSKIDVGVVVGNHQLVPDTAMHHRIEQLLRTHPSRWVVGIAEHEQLELIPGVWCNRLEIRLQLRSCCSDRLSSDAPAKCSPPR